MFFLTGEKPDKGHHNYDCFQFVHQYNKGHSPPLIINYKLNPRVFTEIYA